MTDIKHGLEVLKQNVKIAPVNPGVYRMISDSGEVLYVGKAKNIKKRIVWYTKFEKLPERLKRMVSQVDKMEFIIAENEASALLIENDLIKRFHPRFNILLKDDKSFPYLVIDEKEEFPVLKKYRGKRNEKERFFGPFANVLAVNNVIDTCSAFLKSARAEIRFSKTEHARACFIKLKDVRVLVPEKSVEKIILKTLKE